MELNMNTLTMSIEGFIKIYDPVTNEIFVDKKNAIHYENFSDAMAKTIANKGYGTIYQMAFGNGAASVDQTGLITYLPPNTQVQNASLYNQTYQKVIDDNLLTNTDPANNYMRVEHVSGKPYTDIVVYCTLGYNEPDGQAAFDNGNTIDSTYTFNELGIIANWGVDVEGEITPKLLTHCIFHPVQKSMNRQFEIEYTIRIQALTNMITI